MKHVHLCAALALACVAAIVMPIAPAFAQAAADAVAQQPASPTSIVVATGETVDFVLDHAVNVAWLVFAGVMAKLLGPAWSIVGMFITEKNAKRIIKGKLSEWMLSGKLKPGQPITIDVHNQMVAEFAGSFIRAVPGFITKWLGGEAGVRKIIRNRLPDFLKGLLPEAPAATA